MLIIKMYKFSGIAVNVLRHRPEVDETQEGRSHVMTAGIGSGAALGLVLLVVLVSGLCVVKRR